MKCEYHVSNEWDRWVIRRTSDNTEIASTTDRDHAQHLIRAIAFGPVGAPFSHTD